MLEERAPPRFPMGPFHFLPVIGPVIDLCTQTPAVCLPRLRTEYAYGMPPPVLPEHAMQLEQNVAVGP
jgi:hypothetical protein